MQQNSWVEQRGYQIEDMSNKLSKYSICQIQWNKQLQISKCRQKLTSIQIFKCSKKNAQSAKSNTNWKHHNQVSRNWKEIYKKQIWVTLNGRWGAKLLFLFGLVSVHWLVNQTKMLLKIFLSLRSRIFFLIIFWSNLWYYL